MHSPNVIYALLGICAVLLIVALVLAIFLRRMKFMRQCGKCKRIIKPGDPVALYEFGIHRQSNPAFEIITRPNGRREVMGCLDPECCPDYFIAGHWTKRGFIPTIPDSAPVAVFTAHTGNIVHVYKGKATIL